MFHLRSEGDFARIILSRREARNAIPVTGWQEIATLAERAAESGARAVILSGLPGSLFSAGADIGEFGAFQESEGARGTFLSSMRDGLDRLAALPVPTIALIEGGCYGGAVALAMACDIRIAAPAARFAITPAKLGISYPHEDVQRLVALVGPGQAARLLFTACEIDGAEAQRIGLVEVHMSGAAEAAEEMAREIGRRDANSLAALKRSVRLASQGIASDEIQNQSFRDLLGSETVAERLAAFKGGRG